MDVSDLLAFKPETLPKRKQEEEDAKLAAAAQSKKPKFDEKILELIDAADEDDEGDSDVLDELGLKKLALVFEKRVLNNQKMRLKWPETPAKFMVSFYAKQCRQIVLNRSFWNRSQKSTCMIPLNNCKPSQQSPISTG